MKRKEARDRLLKSSIWKGLLLVFVAALTLAATSFIQYYFSRKGLEEEASKRAETQLRATRNQIMDVINQAESALRNSVWIAKWSLDYPDSLVRVCERIVNDNPVIVGSTAALVPGYLRDKPLFSPYVYRDGDTLAHRSLATEDYDYPSKEWFCKPMELNGEYWSEPYVDTGGGDMTMTTFSVPIKNDKGQNAAVLTGDISLDWLTELIENIKVYPNAYSLMISRTGRFLVCQNKELVMHATVDEIAATVENNADLKRLNKAMLAGEYGKIRMNYRGVDSYVYYAPIERTGWSMCVIIPKDDIFGSIQRIERLVRFFQLLGLLMLMLILFSLVRSQLNYKKLDEKSTQMSNELRIAGDIQMAMIPKVFPPFPERHDIDMSATLVPAKEVGGDLYDFYIREEKLYFCIGDVSGKGVPASLVMAVTRSLFRSLSVHEDSPFRIITAMNKSLSEMNENNMFVTFFCGVLDLPSGKLRYCNAGHNAPLVFTNHIYPLPVRPNLPLGVIPDMEFDEQERQLEFDDALFLYTDGLSEAENLNHELFGTDRMLEVLKVKRDAQSHLDAMIKAVSEFVGEAPQSDDLTMLFIHYTNEAPTSSSRHRLVLRNDISQIPLLEGFVDKVAEQVNMDPSTALSLNLALEEAVTNVMMYAYPEGQEGEVDLEARVLKNKLEFMLSDSGTPFDPTTAPDVDVDARPEERRIGGLGIHLIRNIMDSVSYEWTGTKNKLLMTKNI